MDTSCISNIFCNVARNKNTTVIMSELKTKRKYIKPEAVVLDIEPELILSGSDTPPNSAPDFEDGGFWG